VVKYKRITGVTNVNPRFKSYVVKLCKLSETNSKILFCEFTNCIQTWNINVCFWNCYKRWFFFFIEYKLYMCRKTIQSLLWFLIDYIFFLILNVCIMKCTGNRVGIISINHTDTIDFNTICGIIIIKAFVSFIYF